MEFQENPRRHVNMVFFRNFKRGNALIDSVLIVVVLFVLAIGGLYGSMVIDEVNTDIQADPDIGAEAKNVTGTLNSNYIPLMDNLFIFAFVLFAVFTVISVFMLDSHPIFFIISVILLVAVLIVSMLLGNAFEEIMQDPEITSYSNQFTYTSWIMEHIVMVVIGLAAMVLTALYVKMRQ